MTTFRVSPPNRKPTIEKSEKFEEIVPRLILAPFSPQAEVKFGEVIINSVQCKPLLIFNPSISMTIQFTNINSDDRISISEYKILVNSREERQVTISWSPIQTGYLRKVIRAQDSIRKAKSFDVILTGMAVNKGIQNSKKKKLKSETNTTQVSQRYSNATMTVNQSTNQKLDIRRETFLIEEKENRLPISLNHTKPVIKSNSASSDYNPLNVLNENTIATNFSRYCSYDSVDAPIKYSSFESEFNSSRHNSIRANLSDEMNLRRSTFSMDIKSVTFSPPKCCFSDSLEREERSSTPTGNVTYEMSDDDVKMTPLKNFVSLIFSPQDTLPVVTSSINTMRTKSLSGLSDIEESFVSNFSFKHSLKNEKPLMYISPPARIMNPNRKSNDFIHRTGSSAIKDRRKHLRTSFSSKKKVSPKKLLSCVQGRSTTFNTSTVERIKSQNSHVLKQVVTSQYHIEDPFFQQLLYSDDKWIDRQEKDIIKWMNSILVPNVELCEEQADWTVDGAEAWIKRNYFCDSVWAANKVSIPLYNAPENLNILRKRKDALLENDYVKVVFSELATQVSRKIIFVREGRDIYADEGIKNKLLQLLACYNPVWLRMGFEAVYKQEIALQPKADFGGLGLFIRKKVIVTSSLIKKTEQEKEATRRNILLKFLQLIFFMDQARIQKLIRHNRCLFNLNAKHKSSQNLLSDFCADLVSGRGYVMKHLKNIGYILQFKQTCIDEYDYTVTNLKDLNDGVRLARLFEILFSEPDLCAKLRVPAIDIENKKHNIEVAMRAAKGRCSIKGNITAEDFVLATRLGSRLKILSFLWQIIYNYLTPLYEKAAIKIQKWWRKHSVRKEAARLQDLQNKDNNARIIQRAWRKYRLRINLSQLTLQLGAQRQKEEESARIIQTRFRGFLVMKRDRDDYLRKVQAVKTIQRWIRCKKQREHFVDLKNAATLIQQRYRAKKIMNGYRTHFLKLRKSAVIIQRRFRATKIMMVQKMEFLQLKNACISVQRRYTALVAMKKERESFIRLKQSVILIQRSYRRSRLAETERKNYQKMRNVAIIIQRRFRAQKLMKLEQEKYIEIRQATAKIQRYFRNYKSTCRMKGEFLTLKKYTIVAQRAYRAKMEARKCRNQFLQMKASAIAIQRWYRSYRETKFMKSQYLHLKTIVIRIQRQFREKQLMKNERRHYMRLRWAAVEIQRQFRAKRVTQVERERYLKLKWTTLLIQRRFRANRATVAQKYEFSRMKIATLVVQRKYRATVLMRKEHRRFLELKAAALKIQRTYRARKLMLIERREFLKLKTATITVQQRYRALKFMKPIRESYLVLNKSSLVVQRQWRMKMARNNFVRTREATIKIQRFWLRVLASKRQQREQQTVEEPMPVMSVENLAAIKIQARWRGYCVRKKILIPKKKSTSDSKLALPQSTLGERYRKAIDQIKTSDLYNVIFKALWNLERVTTFSAKLCEAVAAEGIVPIVFKLMARGNRSEPSLELYRSSISILINLTLYPPTKIVLWSNMNHAEDICQIVHLMQVTHDKVFKKNDLDVFQYCVTFLWLLCQDEPVAKWIAGLPRVNSILKKMKESLERKCPCQKNGRQKRVVRTLPKTETNWYADTKTRTFDDNCFAIFNLYNILYHD